MYFLVSLRNGLSSTVATDVNTFQHAIKENPSKIIVFSCVYLLSEKWKYSNCEMTEGSQSISLSSRVAQMVA